MKNMSLQKKIILLVCGVVLLALVVTNALISSQLGDDISDGIGRSAMNVARIVAQSPVVIDGLAGRSESAKVQQYADQIRRLTDVALVVVFDMNSIRMSHPNEARIGKHVVGGDEAAALSGQEYISYASGTLGPQLRAFVPIYDGGRQVGAVVVGVLLDDVNKAVASSRNNIVIATLFGLAVGTAGALMLARSVKRTLFGFEPAGIARLLEERNAMLQSVREGVLAVDRSGIINLVSDEARRLFAIGGLQGDPVGRHVDEYVPNTCLVRVMASGQAELNQEQDLVGVQIITNRVPLYVGGTIVGAIATFRDKTEINQLAEELTGVRSYAEALRSQAHEFMNKLHVILGMVRLESYDELIRYVRQVADDQQAEVSFVGQRIRDTVVAGLILSKLSRSREIGVTMTLTEDSFLPAVDSLSHDIVTILGNLVDNALEAIQQQPERAVSVGIYCDQDELTIEVTDNGPGIAGEEVFRLGYSTKGDGRGFGLYLVKTAVARLGGAVSIASVAGGTEAIVTIPYQAEGVAE